MVGLFALSRVPCWRVSRRSLTSLNRHFFRSLSSYPLYASSCRLLPLSSLGNVPEILRFTASPQQKRMLRLIENETSWSNFLAWCPASYRSHFESFRADYIRRFSEQPDNSKQSAEGKKGNKSDDDKQNPQGENPSSGFHNLFVLVLLLYILHLILTDERGVIPWESFVEQHLLRGEVDYVRVRPGTSMMEAVVNVKRPNGTYGRQVVLVSGEKNKTFEESFRVVEDQMQLPMEERMEIRYGSPVSASSSIATLVTIMAAAAMIRFLMQTISRSQGKPGSNGSNKQTPDSSSGFGPLFDPTMGMNRIRAALSSPKEMQQATQGITFKDVAGLHGAKQEVVEFVDYLKKPEKFSRLGAKLPRGALLVGPPGCGKTLLVKALANEAGVPFYFMAGSEFMEVVSGVGASRMRQLFKEARSSAPAIIFIDEIDAVGRTRSDGDARGGDTSEKEQTLNQLLVEMDGMSTEVGVIVFAATNRSDVLDKALLRPGRFDRLITIDLPTQEERREMFELHLAKIKLHDPISTLARKLAAQTPGMTGADIANVCNEGALNAVRLDSATVMAKHFEEALHRVIAGAVKKNRVLSLMERERLATHEAGHAVIGWMLKYTDPLLRISIVPRVVSALGFSQTAKQDKHMYNEDELYDRMCMLLGGRVAENFYYSNVSSGAEDDLKAVTNLAYKQIRQFGMNQRVGHLSFDFNSEDQFSRTPFSQNLKTIMDEEAQGLVQRVYQTTKDMMEKHWTQVDKVRTALLDKETLSYEELEALIGPRPAGRKLSKDDWRFEA